MTPKLIFRVAFILSSLPLNSFASRQKFQTWYSTYAQHFEQSSTSATCNATLQQYLNPSTDSPSPNLRIAWHVDCILQNTTETIKANMASAGVVLGLMPSLLSSLGPTLAESSLLMLERPLLSSLLVLGGPALYPFRPFDHQDPLEALKQPSRTLPRIPSSHGAHLMISLVQYLLALAAAVNVVTVSLQLGVQTVVTWKKDQSYYPLAWVILPLAIHLIATARLHASLKKVRILPESQLPRC